MKTASSSCSGRKVLACKGVQFPCARTRQAQPYRQHNPHRQHCKQLLLSAGSTGGSRRAGCGAGWGASRASLWQLKQPTCPAENVAHRLVPWRVEEPAPLNFTATGAAAALASAARTATDRRATRELQGRAVKARTQAAVAMSRGYFSNKLSAGQALCRQALRAPIDSRHGALPLRAQRISSHPAARSAPAADRVVWAVACSWDHHTSTRQEQIH